MWRSRSRSRSRSLYPVNSSYESQKHTGSVSVDAPEKEVRKKNGAACQDQRKFPFCFVIFCFYNVDKIHQGRNFSGYFHTGVGEV